MRDQSHANPTKRHSRRSSSVETLEGRLLLAAHIAGSTTVYATIQAAVNAASPGAVINVDAGNYAQMVTVNKTLTIRGAEAGVDARSASRGGSKESIITGASTSAGVSAAFYIDANDVTLDGFTVQGENNGSNVENSAGILVAPNMSGVHILNNIIQNNVSGLFLANASATDPAIIQHNLFQNNNNNGANGGRGIYTDGSIFGSIIRNVVIDSNTFINNHGGSGTTTAEAAIAFEAQTPGKQSNIRITNNIFQNNGKAVLFFNTTNILFQGNTVTGQTDSAGTVRFEGGDSNVTIENNTIDNNGGAGIAIDSKGVPYDDSGFTIEYNNLYGNSKDWGDKLSVIADADDYDGALNAIDNWWGNASGPSGDGHGTGDAIYGNGNYNAGKQWTESPGGDAVFSPWATTAFATPALPPTPTNFAATSLAPIPPAANPEILLSWQIPAGSQNSFEIDRSVDGVTFTAYTIIPASATSFTDTNVAANTTYYYRISAIDSAGNSANSPVVKVTTSAPAVVALSSLAWVSATVGWGTIQENLSIKGNPLTLRGTVYSTGVGTHAPSTIVYNIGGNYKTFVADIGIDDETDGQGAADFQVYGDGKLLYDSGVLTGTSPVVPIAVNITGVQQLTLVVNPGVAGTIDYDHADWAGAELLA